MADCDWAAMCTLFQQNAERFGLAAIRAPAQPQLQLEWAECMRTFRTVYENGYVKSLVSVWLSSVPEAVPPTDDDTATSEALSQLDISHRSTTSTTADDDAAVTDRTTEHPPTDDARGRFVVVAPGGPPIGADEPVISECAFALVPVYTDPKTAASSLLLCSACGDWRTRPELRCRHCRRVSFCSVRCQQSTASGGEAVHRAECAGHRRGLFAQLGVAHLALHAMLVGVVGSGGGGDPSLLADEKLRAVAGDVDAVWVELLAAAERRVLLAAEDRRLDGYARVVRLNTNYARAPPADLLRYALTAAMLTMYLKEHSSSVLAALSSAAGRPADDAELLTGALIFAHIGQIINNAHTIYDMVPDRAAIAATGAALTVPLGQLHRSLQLDACASALYPRIAMLNHSCAPNIRNRFDGARLTVHATRALPAGAEVLNCYVSADALAAGAERREQLAARYGFECACGRCADAAADDAQFDAYRCAGCGVQIEVDARFRWWLVDVEQEGAEVKQPAVQCPECGRPLDWDWYDRFMVQFEMQASGAAQRKMLARDTCEAYAEMVRALGEPHQLRGAMAAMVVRLFAVGELDLNERDAAVIDALLPVARDYAHAMRSRFGRLSLEHLDAAHTWLDLQALRRRLHGIAVDVGYVGELRAVVEACVSAQTRPTYERYFDTYLV